MLLGLVPFLTITLYQFVTPVVITIRFVVFADTHLTQYYQIRAQNEFNQRLENDSLLVTLNFDDLAAVKQNSLDECLICLKIFKEHLDLPVSFLPC